MNSKDCKFFGVTTPEVRSKRKICKKCAIDNPRVYLDCIDETNKLLSLPVDLIDGEQEMNDEISEVSVEQSGINQVANPQVINVEPEKPKRKPAVVTKGVLELAKDLIRSGKSDREVIEGLIVKYTEAGKSAKQAKHNALTTLFHAHKRVNNELTNKGQQV